MSTCGRWSGFRGCPLLSWRVPSLLSSLSLCAWYVSPEYGSVWRFKGVFRGFCGFRVGLCCLGALRGLCGFCARVRLGGYMTYCVFAFLFLLLSLCLLFFYALCLLCFGCPLVLPSLFALVSLWVCVCCCFFFPYGCIDKKKGRKVFLRPLLSCCGLVYKSLNITVISCGSSFQCLFPLQIMPATSSGRFVVSFTICPFLSIVEYFQWFRQSEG